ncbi:acyl-CoA dehydrogenase family protein [Streptomyces sp. 5-8]|uniref:Acyl-CoA dehydrogenase family protein n=1 Tax=Streptomyces musisoli TaxID=2802280 RepID=A0ABS1NV01_9ACTN|nr:MULTISPECIES: acyl-CoA dehydrogenase family protein [Streptomyces]MBL1103939.1 acyl-CoA dehydrogenase family protein [Streptomyces musisoli]MBY8845346.1 acyl-CoA dehydrogenase family protein [Streptomyces sp. SP2-10]
MTVSVLQEMSRGGFPWDRLRSFPRQSEADRRAGDEAVRAMTRVLDTHVPDGLDGRSELPGGLLDALHEAGFLAMLLPREDGGLALSDYNGFRVLETAAERAPAISMLLSAHNALGPIAFLPAVPDGELRELLAKHVAAGTVGALASTEPEGAGNTGRSTVARPTADGSGYLLTGEKMFITNGAAAGLVAVTATVEGGGDGDQVGLFFVELPAEGFEVVAHHAFMGLHATPISHLRLTEVFVPAGHTLPAQAEWRRASPYAEIHALARVYVTSAPSMALARRCLEWSRSFVAERAVDGRELASYEAIRQLLAESVADVYAMDSAVRWAMLHTDATALNWERDALKNLTSMTAWRVVDRTVSLLGARGYETADSKAARGLAPHPVEQAQREIRGMRVAGGVDFNLDRYLAARMLAGYYRDGGQVLPGTDGALDAGALSPGNRAHLEAVREDVGRLARICRELTGAQPAAELLERQQTLIAVNRIATELFTMAVVLARAAQADEQHEPNAQDLAAVVCDGARARLAPLWEQVAEEPPAAYGRLVRALLDGAPDHLLHP